MISGKLRRIAPFIIKAIYMSPADRQGRCHLVNPRGSLTQLAPALAILPVTDLTPVTRSIKNINADDTGGRKTAAGERC